MDHSKTLIILPSAGFGTRMGLNSVESKEMLEDPGNDGKHPLIQWSLDLAKEETNKVVITREEKSNLVDYLADQQVFTLLVSDVTQEWPATVLHSKVSWDESNILVLPDTRWKYDETPSCIVWDIQKELEAGADLVFALHSVPDVRLWGKVLLDPFSQKPLSTQEKPNIQFKLDGLAWGLIGFKKAIGEQLFQAYLDKKVFTFPKNWKVKVLFLESFKDVTRTGIVEAY